MTDRDRRCTLSLQVITLRYRISKLTRVPLKPGIHADLKDLNVDELMNIRDCLKAMVDDLEMGIVESFPRAKRIY